MLLFSLLRSQSTRFDYLFYVDVLSSMSET